MGLQMVVEFSQFYVLPMTFVASAPYSARSDSIVFHVVMHLGREMFLHSSVARYTELSVFTPIFEHDTGVHTFKVGYSTHLSF